MKKKAFTQLFCTSLSALTCTATLAVTLSLTGYEQPESGNITGNELITEITDNGDENDSFNTTNTSDESDIMPLGDWGDEFDKKTSHL